MLLLIENNNINENCVDAYVIHTGGNTLDKGIELAHDLRKNGISVDLDPEVKGFKAQFKKAEREKASFFIIIGEDELSEGKVAVKNQKTGEQTKIEFSELAPFLSDFLTK